MGYFRTIGAMTIGNPGRIIVLMVKEAYLFILYFIHYSPKITGCTLLKFSGIT